MTGTDPAAAPRSAGRLAPGGSHPHRASGGFTLIEVLIAAVVLTAGLVMALQSIASGLGASTQTARRAVATALAADRLAVAAAEDVVTPSGDQTRGGVTYRWQVQSTPQGGDVDELTCTVTWDDARGRQEISLSRRAWGGWRP